MKTVMNIYYKMRQQLIKKSRVGAHGLVTVVGGKSLKYWIYWVIRFINKY